MKKLMFDHNSRSATLRGYLAAINILFALRGFTTPADLSNRTNICTMIIKNRESEEDIARKRNPITKEMYAAIIEARIHSVKDSIEDVFADWLSFIRITGLRCAEFAQKTQTKIDIHIYPSGRQVVKAFICRDWKFFDKQGIPMNVHPLNKEIITYPSKVEVTFRIQKNRQNGQELTIVIEPDHLDICPVCAAYRIFIRAKRLGQLDYGPMGVYLNKQGNKKYLTGNSIANLLQKVARSVHPEMSEEDIQKISVHSGRVWALVLLDEAGMTPDFMKCRLRWESESYRLYLRDTSTIQQKHISALKNHSQEVMRLLGRNKNILPNIVPVDDDMGKYA